MLRLIAVHGHLHHAPVDRVVLDHEARFRRRAVLEAESGTRYLLDLSEAVWIPDGAALILEDGREVAVEAAVEPLMRVRAADAGALTRIAWHLGNRHVPTEIMGDQLRLARDHVLEEMIKGLGGAVDMIEAPFEPEMGAYAKGGHGHHHHHGHDHGHSHGDDHQH
jgi:urease accessory protein